jgi:hypothetical protein
VIFIPLTVVKSLSYGHLKRTLFRVTEHLRGPLGKFVNSPYNRESELCGGAVTSSFSKYLYFQAITPYNAPPTSLKRKWSNKVSPRTLQTALVHIYVERERGRKWYSSISI